MSQHPSSKYTLVSLLISLDNWTLKATVTPKCANSSKILHLFEKNLAINLYIEWIIYIWFGHVASSTQWNSPETELLSNLGYIYHCLLAIRVIKSCENLMELIYFPFNFFIHSFTTSSITHSIFSSAYMHWNCIKIRLFLVVLINLVSTYVMGVWWSVLFTPLDLWPHSDDLTWKDFRTGLLRRGPGRWSIFVTIHLCEFGCWNVKRCLWIILHLEACTDMAAPARRKIRDRKRFYEEK